MRPNKTYSHDIRHTSTTQNVHACLWNCIYDLDKKKPSKCRGQKGQFPSSHRNMSSYSSNDLTKWLTKASSVLRNRLPVAQLVNKFLAFWGIRSFNHVFTALSAVHTLTYYSTSSFHLLDLPSRLFFPSVHRLKRCLHLSRMRSTHPLISSNKVGHYSISSSFLLLPFNIFLGQMRNKIRK